MKLISIYIENFGGLSHYALDFEAGITALVQPNGFGKTTLAEFIRAMFYGFPRKNKMLERSLRQKYMPWSGGQFGGNLVFVHQGRAYRIERTFGENPRSDTFAVIDPQTGRKTDRFTEEPGRELFGLDAESFARSTYLPQVKEEGPLATASIQAKLTELVEDGSDVGNYDKAVAALKAERSARIPYRGAGGSVAEAAGKITRLQLQLDAAEKQQEQCLQLQQEIARKEAEQAKAQAELTALQQDIDAAVSATEASLRQAQYAQLCSRYRKVAAQADALQTAFPAGFPDRQTLRGAEIAADRLAVLEEQKITTASDLQAQALLEKHAQLPAEQQLRSCRSDCETYEALRSRVRAAQQETAQRTKRAGQTGIAACIALLSGIAVLAAGMWLLFAQKVTAGAVAAGVGVAAVVTALALWRRCPQKDDENGAQLQRELEQCAGRISAFLKPYAGAVEPEQFLFTLAKLEHTAAAYAQARQQLRDWQQRKEAHSAGQEACRRELAAFFDRYQIKMGEDPRAQLYQLRDDLQDARVLLSQKQELQTELEEFRRQYGNIPEPVQTMDPQMLKAQEKTLRSAVAALNEELLQDKQQLQLLRLQTARIVPLREELEQLQLKLAQEREAAEILDATLEFLQQARENLSTAYLGTIRARFGYYLSQLEAAAGESHFIDPEFRVQLERGGKARELAYFSAGQTDLLMLCMRLALVDALFKEQEMFVILDDPFVNLDDAHTALAGKLLRKLAQRRQILYLTCHSSRIITEN